MNAPQLLVYTSRRTPRIAFIFNILLRDIAGLDFRLTHNSTEFIQWEGPKLSYCDQQLCDEIFFFASRILFEKGIEDQHINVFEWKGVPVFFGTHPKYVMPFDPFAASFYLVSRYEEYLPHIKDDHMRFSPQQSLAYQKGFLQLPVVNIWGMELKNILANRYPQLVFREHHYRYLSTFDIDSAYAYLEKGLMRQVGAFALDLFNLNFQRITERIRVLARMEKDPYDTYEWQLSIVRKYKLKQLYFFLVGDYGEFDKNITLESSRKMQSLIKSLADYADIGVHPSYGSNGNRKQVKRELQRLSKVLKRDITKSRQHFLKITFPDTYRNLIELDVQEDFTMGYASEIGFRASICIPYNFYDLDLDVETKLKLIPFMLMDGTMKDYMKLSPQQAIDRAKQLVDEVKKVNGKFVTLWHNHSVNNRDEWKDWRSVYETIVAYAVPSPIAEKVE
jgi:hypothetical protein